jgi:hypothetical protein
MPDSRRDLERILTGTGRRPVEPTERVALGALVERFPLVS